MKSRYGLQISLSNGWCLYPTQKYDEADMEILHYHTRMISENPTFNFVGTLGSLSEVRALTIFSNQVVSIGWVKV